MAWKTTRALLLVADIGGYTRFMRLHRMSLAHAQENAEALLRAAAGAAPRLRLIEIEGDAASFYVPEPQDEEISSTVVDVAAAMHRAFHAEQGRQVSLDLCVCDACCQTGELRLKFVAHVGEVAVDESRRRTQLAGVDVILVHRLLKNDVPAGEYVLLTEPAYERCAGALPVEARELEQDVLDLGPTRVRWVDLAELAEELPAAPSPSLAAKVRHEAGKTLRSLPYYVGLKRSKVLGTVPVTRV